MCKGACARCGDSVWSNEARVHVGHGYAHVRCPRAPGYYATTAAAAAAAGDDVLSSYEANAAAYDTDVGAGSPLTRMDSVQIDDPYASPRGGSPLRRLDSVEIDAGAIADAFAYGGKYASPDGSPLRRIDFVRLRRLHSVELAESHTL